MKISAIKQILGQIREFSCRNISDAFWDIAMQSKNPGIEIRDEGFAITFDRSSVHLYEHGGVVHCRVQSGDSDPHDMDVKFQNSARMVLQATMRRLLMD